MNDENQNAAIDAAAYSRQRLDSLLELVQACIPTATGERSDDGAFGYVSANIRFQNGITVLAACDADVPQALFEVVRFVAPSQPAKYPFERRGTLGAAFTDKMSRAGVLQLLRQYDQLAESTPRGQVE